MKQGGKIGRYDKTYLEWKLHHFGRSEKAFLKSLTFDTRPELWEFAGDEEILGMSIPGRETSQGKCKWGNDLMSMKNHKKVNVARARGEWKKKERWMER